MNFTIHRDAQLRGYTGPYYPPCVSKLQKVVSKIDISRPLILEQYARQVPGYVRDSYEYTTTDGYTWCTSLMYYRYRTGIILILFPWCTKSVNGQPPTNRSIAVYKAGYVNLEVIRTVVYELVKALTTSQT